MVLKRAEDDFSAAQNSSAPTLATTVHALRLEAMQCDAGTLIGSEDDLLARHGVSRPTLRKAAALVAQEQLLQVRRGVGGGYIARRPTSRAVAHMAAIYLTSRDAGIDQILASMQPIRSELTRLAAENISDEVRLEFMEFHARRPDFQDGSDGILTFAKNEREYGRLLGLASGNTVLALFQDILFDLAANISRENDIYLRRPDRMQTYVTRRGQILDAILDGDPSLAVMLSHRLSALHKEWLLEGPGKSSKAANAD